MRGLRKGKRKDGGKSLKLKDMCSGPSKLTQAFSIDKAAFNQKHICESDHVWLEAGDDTAEHTVVACPRIGIDYAGDWAKKPLRFYVLGNESVSVKDKAEEQKLAGTASKYFS